MSIDLSADVESGLLQEVAAGGLSVDALIREAPTAYHRDTALRQTSGEWRKPAEKPR